MNKICSENRFILFYLGRHIGRGLKKWFWHVFSNIYWNLGYHFIHHKWTWYGMVSLRKTPWVNEHLHFLWKLVTCNDGKFITITINAYMGMIHEHHYFPWIKVTHSHETSMTIITLLYVVMLVFDKGSSPFILKINKTCCNAWGIVVRVSLMVRIIEVNITINFYNNDV